jgi:hypothetical protein
MIDNPVNDGIRRQEGDNLHPTAAFWADHRVNLYFPTLSASIFVSVRTRLWTLKPV